MRLRTPGSRTGCPECAGSRRAGPAPATPGSCSSGVTAEQPGPAGVVGAHEPQGVDEFLSRDRRRLPQHTDDVLYAAAGGVVELVRLAAVVDQQVPVQVQP